MSSTGTDESGSSEADMTGTFVIVSLYLACMVLVGVYYFFKNKQQVNKARGQDNEGNQNKGENIVDLHFLGGRSFGALLLTFTMFATVFSGYTVVGIPGEAFRNGFQAYRWVSTVFVIVGMFVVLYPRLRKLSIHYHFNSPTDLIAKRYNNKYLHWMCIFCMVIPTLLYLIAQFKSISGTATALLGGNKTYGMFSAIVLGILIFIIESLGGLRSVAATDVIQSIFLISGFLTVPGLLMSQYGSLGSNMQFFIDNDSDFLDAPEVTTNVGNWTWLVSLASFPLYPHLIQRLYAAKDNKTLKKTWTAMSFAPWLTVTPGILIGVYAKRNLPPDTSSTQVFGGIVKEMLSFGPFAYLVASIVWTASLAAIMSTADSALIAISNIVTIDVYKKYMQPGASGKSQLLFSKLVSFICVAIAVAVCNEQMDLSTLLAVQGGILIQILPAFLCGLYSESVAAVSLLSGVVVGTLITIILQLLVFRKVIKPTDFHGLSAGLWGIISNIIVVFIYQLLFKPSDGDDGIPYVEIQVRMKKVIEPVKHNIGRFLTPIAIVFSIFMNPFFFEAGPVYELSSGLPGWAIWMIVLNVFWFVETVYALQIWEDPSEFDKKEKLPNPAGKSLDMTYDDDFALTSDSESGMPVSSSQMLPPEKKT